MIEICLGIWHDSISLGIGLSALAEVETVLGTSTFRAELTRDRTIELMAGDQRFVNAGEDQRPGLELRLDCVRPKDAVVETARCQYHWIGMQDMGGKLVHQLDHDHRLPWPRVRKCDSYWVPDELFREVMIRRRSAVAAKHRWETPPGSIVAKLEARHRLQLASIKHMDEQNRAMLNPRIAA